MMKFDYELLSIKTDALALEYFLVPWDTEIVGRPVAQIRSIEINDPEGALQDFQAFVRWRDEQSIFLCNCRLPHDRLVESGFLEMMGFRFIELNYRPSLRRLQELEIPDDVISVADATDQDRGLLSEMAGHAFRHGRFHQDPRLGSGLGDERYRTWLLNAFALPHQEVLKCHLHGEVVGFFVVEKPEPENCFWSLVGLAPGRQGQGLGKRVWRSVLARHKSEGVQTVTTSISSHNTAVLNLYVSLGFRFPPPRATFHWADADVEAT